MHAANATEATYRYARTGNRARPAPAEGDLEHAIAHLCECVKSAGRALELIDQIITIGRRDPLIEVEPEPVRVTQSKLREWLHGVQETYNRLHPAPSAPAG